nr:MAG TPA: hypothetical protein [Caudoviricetes sp.]
MQKLIILRLKYKQDAGMSVKDRLKNLSFYLKMHNTL